MKIIKLLERAGNFAENKDVARDIRLREILPALAQGEDVIIDFSGVQSATQSFVHALISDVFRIHGIESLDHLQFKDCVDTVRKIITIVIDYMQESE